MRMGTRWTSGDEPPANLPAEIRAEIAAVEASMPTEEPAPRWTLTWLEGRPVADLDTGVTVTIDRDGHAVVRHDDDV